MNIEGTYRGFAPTIGPIVLHEIELVVTGDQLKFRIAEPNGPVEVVTPRNELRAMTLHEIAALFQEGTNLRGAYGLSVDGEGAIFLWQPPGRSGPRLVKRNLEEDIISNLSRWFLFDAEQVAAGQFQEALERVDPGVEILRLSAS